MTLYCNMTLYINDLLHSKTKSKKIPNPKFQLLSKINSFKSE